MEALVGFQGRGGADGVQPGFGHALLFGALLPTVCPAHNAAHMLSDQEVPTSIQVWRGHNEEAKRGEAGGQRITRHVQRWGCCSSRVRLPRSVK